MNYEVIKTATGKSLGIYESEAVAKRRYPAPDYKVVKTAKPANAFPVGFAVL